MLYPPLEDGHEVLGTDYCPGFSDAFGKWNTGFYCPPILPDVQVYCCGTLVLKYCCTVGKPVIPGGQYNYHSSLDSEGELDIHEEEEEEEIPDIPVVLQEEPDLNQRSLFIGILCGLVAMAAVMTIVSCFYCSCCVLYKKRRNQLSGGLLYSIPPSSSSTTTCGLINSLSSSIPPNTNNNSSFITSPLVDYWSNTGGGGSSNSSACGSTVIVAATATSLSPPGMGQPQHIHSGSVYHHHHHYTTGPIVMQQPPQVLEPPPPYLAVTQNQNQQQQQANSQNRTPSNGRLIQRQLSYLQQSRHPTGEVNSSQAESATTTSTITTANSPQNNSPSNPSALTRLLSSTSSTGGGRGSLPPPYFVEQYRIRNRVRAPPFPNSSSTTSRARAQDTIQNLLYPILMARQNEPGGPRRVAGDTQSEPRRGQQYHQLNLRAAGLHRSSSDRQNQDSPPGPRPLMMNNLINDLSGTTGQRDVMRNRSASGGNERSNIREINYTLPSGERRRERRRRSREIADNLQKILNTNMRGGEPLSGPSSQSNQQDLEMDQVTRRQGSTSSLPQEEIIARDLVERLDGSERPLNSVNDDLADEMMEEDEVIAVVTTSECQDVVLVAGVSYKDELEEEEDSEDSKISSAPNSSIADNLEESESGKAVRYEDNNCQAGVEEES